jgi:IS4 transposase
MKLYRISWQIELLFKEWKSHNNLKKFVTRQPHLVKGLIWASLLSLLIKRYIWSRRPETAENAFIYA